MWRRIGPVILSALALTTPTPAQAGAGTEPPPQVQRQPCPSSHALRGHDLVASLGVYDNGNADLSVLGLEWRFPRWKADFRPILGWTASSGNDTYLYAGMRYDWEFVRSWTLAPSFSVGVYDGGVVELGGPLTLRSGLEANFQVTNHLVAGIGFYHFSNGRIYADNPGANALQLSLGYSL